MKYDKVVDMEEELRRAKKVELYVESGIYSVNEARRIMGLDPIEGGNEPLYVCHRMTRDHQKPD